MNPEIFAALRQFADIARALPENTDLWTYTIPGYDGSPYLSRTLLPRVGGLRPIIHNIHREDSDVWMHNHPWVNARFLVVSGGYVEERLVDGRIVTTVLAPGSVNLLDAGTYHRVTEVLPDTWTFGLVGERVQDWGFLVEGVHVPHREYWARRGHRQPEGGKS